MTTLTKGALTLSSERRVGERGRPYGHVELFWRGEPIGFANQSATVFEGVATEWPESIRRHIDEAARELAKAVSA